MASSVAVKLLTISAALIPTNDGCSPMAALPASQKPSPQTSVEPTYQILRVNSVSTSGAHSHLKIRHR